MTTRADPERDRVLDDAVRKGKILARSKASYAKRWDRDPAATRELIASLAALDPQLAAQINARDQQAGEAPSPDADEVAAAEIASQLLGKHVEPARPLTENEAIRHSFGLPNNQGGAD